MRFLILCAAAALPFVAGSAHAQDRDPCGRGLVCASDPERVMRGMEKAGLKPRKSADAEGDPLIGSDEAAYPFEVYFYGCERHVNCDSLRFQVVFRKDADNSFALANKWNANSRFLQAAVKDDGRLVVAYDLATIGGVTERNFGDVLDWWKSQLEELGAFFQKELELKPVKDTKAQ